MLSGTDRQTDTERDTYTYQCATKVISSSSNHCNRCHVKYQYYMLLQHVTCLCIILVNNCIPIAQVRPPDPLFFMVGYTTQWLHTSSRKCLEIILDNHYLKL